MRATAKLAFPQGIRKREPYWSQKSRGLAPEASFGLIRRKRLEKWTEVLSDIPREQVLVCRLECSEPGIEEEFRQLVEQWRAATLLSSSMTEMCMHPAYVRIIGLGKAAVPLLLRELQTDPDHWFWALYAITGANPVTPGDAGDLEKMSEVWIRWGKAHRYI